MNKEFLQDQARWKLFLKELGINQGQASEMLGNHPHSLNRTISLAKEQDRPFPESLIKLMNFMDAVKKMQTEKTEILQ